MMRTSKKRKMFVVNWELFPYDVLVCLGSTYEEIIKYIGKLGYKLNEEELQAIKMDGNGRTVILRGGQIVMWLRDYPRIGSSIVAHEIFHAVTLMLQRAGVTLSNDSDEVYAYAISYLTENVNQEI